MEQHNAATAIEGRGWYLDVHLATLLVEGALAGQSVVEAHLVGVLAEVDLKPRRTLRQVSIQHHTRKTYTQNETGGHTQIETDR